MVPYLNVAPPGARHRRRHGVARGHRRPREGGDADAPGPARGGRRYAGAGPPHLGRGPGHRVVVSWASPGRRPGRGCGSGSGSSRPSRAPYTDGINGETVWTYHARVGGLRPGATYGYAVTADNDATPPIRSAPPSAPRPRDGRRSGSPASATWPRRTPTGCSPTARPPTRSARWSSSSRCSTCSTATCATPT